MFGVALGGLVSLSVLADGLTFEEEQRVNLGVKLFPACLSADQALGERLDQGGALLLLVVEKQESGSEKTARIVEYLRELGSLRDYPLRVEQTTPDRVENYRDRPLGGILLISPRLDGRYIEEWVVRRQTLLFSPFLGDVERGAVCGVQVTDRILPLVNLKRAEAAGVRFKPFFLRVAAQL